MMERRRRPGRIAKAGRRTEASEAEQLMAGERTREREARKEEEGQVQEWPLERDMRTPKNDGRAHGSDVDKRN